MRAFSTTVACAVVGLLAACQDSYSSNSERDTHMGAAHAAAPPSGPPAALGLDKLPPPLPVALAPTVDVSPDSGPDRKAGAASAKDGGSTSHARPVAPY